MATLLCFFLVQLNKKTLDSNRTFGLLCLLTGSKFILCVCIYNNLFFIQKNNRLQLVTQKKLVMTFKDHFFEKLQTFIIILYNVDVYMMGKFIVHLAIPSPNTILLCSHQRYFHKHFHIDVSEFHLTVYFPIHCPGKSNKQNSFKGEN